MRKTRGGVPPDKALVASFSGLRQCQYCRKPTPHGSQAHHVFSRGAGGPDVRVNLIALGGPWDCNCHGEVHAGNILRADLLAVVAAREGCLQGDIEETIWRLRREPKRCPGNAGRRPK